MLRKRYYLIALLGLIQFGLFAQVGIWTTIQISLANPSSSFETNAQHRASQVDLGSGRYTASVLLLTIADNNSLRMSIGGTGNGYQIRFRTNGEVEDLAVTKITRISFLKD
ncbi:hypothetical protein [Aureitalea marina]|nr:hypothetical protein [Aureitalea marina]